MSRVSQKSSLSRSVTRGSNAIDLGKDSGVDMGRKAQPSVTSGGIGITQEVTNVGGVSVTGGVNVDLTPVDFGISVNPSEGTVSVATGAEIPGGLLGISGGIEIDTNTGQVIGGSLGGEIGGLGINVSNSQKDGLGIEFTVQIPGTPIELSVGFGFPPKEEPKLSQGGETNPNNMGQSPEDILPLLSDDVCYDLGILEHPKSLEAFIWEEEVNIFVRASRRDDWHGGGVWVNNATRWNATVVETGYTISPAFIEEHVPAKSMYSTSEGYIKGNFKAWAELNGSAQIIIPNGFRYYESVYGPWRRKLTGKGVKEYIANYRGSNIWSISVFQIPCSIFDTTPNLPRRILYDDTKSPSSSNPFPNPPPRKKRMDECCRDSLKLLRSIKVFSKEILRLLGREAGEEGLLPITGAPGLLGEKIKRIETPITDGKKLKEVEISFPTIYQLLTYCLKQSNDLDVALDPKSFKIPAGYIQNPNYNRDSEHSLKYNDQPNRDKTGEKREFKINDDEEAKIGGFLEQQKYVFDALRRLEYLFPSGEFKDFKIDKSLIAPGKTGDMQVHNHFQTLEVLFQYLNSSLGNPREPIHVADTNPGKAGSQPITITPFSLSHLMREIFKYIVDMEGDQDSQLNLEVRNFRTSLANRVQIIQIAEMVKALYEDTGMVEKQDYIKVKLEGDPYAGCYQEGKGFEPKKELDENTEEATEKLLEATLRNFEMKIKVSRRDNKKDPNDLRDVIIELYQKLTEHQGGRAIDVDLVEQELKKAEFNVSLDNALARANVKKSLASSRYRTRKKKR